MPARDKRPRAVRQDHGGRSGRQRPRRLRLGARGAAAAAGLQDGAEDKVRRGDGKGKGGEWRGGGIRLCNREPLAPDESSAGSTSTASLPPSVPTCRVKCLEYLGSHFRIILELPARLTDLEVRGGTEEPSEPPPAPPNPVLSSLFSLLLPTSSNTLLSPLLSSPLLSPQPPLYSPPPSGRAASATSVCVCSPRARPRQDAAAAAHAAQAVRAGEISVDYVPQCGGGGV